MTDTRKRFVRDLILIASLLIVGTVGIFLPGWVGGRYGLTAEVTVDGELVAAYPLDRDGVYPISGGKNVLVIEDGYAYMQSADCPDKICVGQGKISRPGACITCLPNRTQVVIVSNDDPNVQN